MDRLGELTLPWHGERINSMTPGIVDGRDIRAGYGRGISLQWGNAMEVISRDDIFSMAYELVRGRTIVTPHCLSNLYMLTRFYLRAFPVGDIAEFGARMGGSAMLMALISKSVSPQRKIFAFDTFVGCPVVDDVRDAHRQWDFGPEDGVDLAEIREFAGRHHLDNMVFVEGVFDDVADDALRCSPGLALSHIDCDTFPGVVSAYEITRRHAMPGSYIVFDDGLLPSCIGAFQAVEDLAIRRDGLSAEQVWPHLVYRMG